jgi:putative oxidoreductase
MIPIPASTIAMVLSARMLFMQVPPIVMAHTPPVGVSAVLSIDRVFRRLIPPTFDVGISGPARLFSLHGGSPHVNSAREHVTGVPVRLRRWAPVAVRIAVGAGFIAHGAAKMQRGPDDFAQILAAMGTPWPHLASWLTIGTELLGGLAILVGAFVRLASIPMAAVLVVAAVTVHLPYGFSSIRLLAVEGGRARFGPPGYETALLYLACLVMLVLSRPGPWSIDDALRRRRSRHRGDRSACRTVQFTAAMSNASWDAVASMPVVTLRVARPASDLAAAVRFYERGVGLARLASFEDHEGFDGVMLGLPGTAYHLELTHAREQEPSVPSRDNLLVFYLPERRAWQAAVDRMAAAGYSPVPSFNPYWDRSGRTFEDPDGYRVVLENDSWP